MTRNRLPLAALLAANTISIAGNALTFIAVPWFVLQTTGSVEKTGLVGFFSLLPFAISSALSGVLVDRLGYRRMSMLADVASGVSVLAVPVLYHFDALPLWSLLVLVFTGALLDAPGQTAREAILPDLAALAGTTIERATSLFDGVSRGARMVGAPVGGILIATLGSANVLLVDAATFVASAILVAVFLPKPKPAEHERAPYLRELREGFAFLWQNRLIRAIVAMVVLTNALDAAMGGVLMPVYADSVLDSVVALGAMGGVWGAGALGGTLVFAWMGHRLPKVSTLVLAFTIGGATRYLLLAAEPGLETILVWFAISGFAIGAVNPIFGTLLYGIVPTRMRGRVFGAVSAGVMAAAPLGALLGAYSIALIGLRETLVAFGFVYAVCTLSPLVVPAWRQVSLSSASTESGSQEPLTTSS